MPVIYVIYHGNCYDGFTAAWVAKQAHPDAVLLPANHGEPIPDTPLGATVYMIDIAFPRALMDAYRIGRNLRVLDHHKTAEAALKDFPNCVFDMQRSGAMLAWHEFFPDFTVPWLVGYTQDRDLWRFALPAAAEVFAFIESFPRTLEAYDELERALENDLANSVEAGCVVLRMKAQRIADIVKNWFPLAIGGHIVPVVNTATFFSEAAAKLCEDYPKSQFSAYYFRREPDVNQFGLRSANGFDVSEIAKLYGGGGHHTASGFQVTDRELLAMFEDRAL